MHKKIDCDTYKSENGKWSPFHRIHMSIANIVYDNFTLYCTSVAGILNVHFHNTLSSHFITTYYFLELFGWKCFRIGSTTGVINKRGRYANATNLCEGVVPPATATNK